MVALSFILHRPGDADKIDRCNGARLAELLRTGELRASWLPDLAHEVLRNLWHAREDALRMRVNARQQLKAY
jgi:hypothetical protein